MKGSLGLSSGDAKAKAKDMLESGKAYEQFKTWIALQGGDPSYAEDFSKFGSSKHEYDVLSDREGYILSCNAEAVGIAAMKLGAGRATKDDVIDHKAGILLFKKPGDKVLIGDVIARLYTDREYEIDEARDTVLGSLKFTDKPLPEAKMIYKTIR